MLHYLRVAILLAFVFLFAPSVQAATNQGLEPGTYEGITPCADCPGINTVVVLRGDGTYTLTRIYIGRSGTSKESGKWWYDSERGQLTLSPSGSASRERFSVTFLGQLHMLDANGNPLPGRTNSTLSEVGGNSTALASTSWKLTELGGKPITLSKEQQPTLAFEASGDRVSGQGTCNRFNGPYTQNGNALSFGAAAATRMMCLDSKTEDAYFAMLLKVASFARQGELLTFFDKGGSALATFTAEAVSGGTSSSLVSTGWTLMELNGKTFTPVEKHPVTMIFDASGHNVSGSGGCNRYSGTYKQDGNKLTFGNQAVTAMLCGDMTGEAAFLQMLPKVASFKREGESLTLFDKDGTAIAKFAYEQ